MFGLFTNRCPVCGNILKEQKYRWQLEGRKAWVCSKCNVQLRRGSSPLAFAEGVMPLPDAQGSGIGFGYFVGTVMTAGLAAALVYVVWFQPSPKDSQETSSPQSLASPDAGSPALPTDQPSSTDNVATAMLPPGNEMIVLESTDGRSIRAQILTLTPTTVIIRREDKVEFLIPLSKFTAETIQRLDAYRPKLPATNEAPPAAPLQSRN